MTRRTGLSSCATPWSLPILGGLLIALLCVAEAPPAGAAFQDLSERNFCGGGPCSDQDQACVAASNRWWPSNPKSKLLSCTMNGLSEAKAVVEGFCCGDTNFAEPKLTCPNGTRRDPDGPRDACTKIKEPPQTDDDKNCGGNQPSCNKSVGNPISLVEGNKEETVVDFSTGGVNPLVFLRRYNSDNRAQTAIFTMPLGRRWQSNFDRYLRAPNADTRILYRPGGTVVTFTRSGSDWLPPDSMPFTLAEVGGNWEFTDLQDDLEVYDSNRRLISITKRNGYQQSLAYDAQGRLESVTDSYGRSFTFEFTGKRLTRLTAPDGSVYRYVYDHPTGEPYMPLDRLVEVIHPHDGAPGEEPRTLYHYEDPDLPGYLTGITDERGLRYATWAYDADGRAISSEHAGGAEATSIIYHPDHSRTVTGPLGQQTIYRFTEVAGMRRLTSIERQASANVPAATETRVYGPDGYIDSRTDFEGNVTTYVHDARGLQTSRTEAVGTPEERSITTTWHPSFRVPDVVTEPGRTTDYDYDAQGRMTSVTVTDTTGHTVPYSTNGETRTWTYTYNASGQVLTVDGPRDNVTDVADVTTFEYDAEGNREKVIDALGHTTHITAFNARGLPLTILDPNGVETELDYNPRGWLEERRVKHASGDAVTRFGYDDAGLVTRVTLPNGVEFFYEYDDAQRLKAVRNDLNERIDYLLDAKGNRTSETVKSATGIIKRSQTRVFDELGRLLRSIGAASQTWAYLYDDNGNIETITDPASEPTQRAFDALDRLIQITDPDLETVGYDYDARDNLTEVTDPRSLTTTYTHNAFGDVIQLDSPDTGIAVYLVDPAGNTTQMTDARGVVTDFTYDALDRVLTKSFPADPAQNVTYGYDDTTGGNPGKGRRTSASDESGSSAYRYDHRGNLVEETRVIDGKSFTTHYGYDLADTLVKITYPSGRIVNYLQDSLGRVSSVTTQENAAAIPVTVADAISYLPFGPMESFTYGNGMTVTYAYDQDYRLEDIDSGDGGTTVQDLTIVYDGRDNITAITDNLDPARDQGFGYDKLSRLTSATGAYGSIAYTYDGVGNRRTRDVTLGGTTTNEVYTYALDSNRLETVDVGGTLRTVTHGLSGNITADDRGADPNLGFDYNQDDRLVQVTQGGLPSKQYVYNAGGERVIKQAPGGLDPEYFHYDQGGRLLAESDGTGAYPRSYIFLNGMIIAQVEPGAGGGMPIDVILDDGDAGTTPSGTWDASSAGSGFEGSGHRVRPAPPEGLEGGQMIDNGDAGFSVFGSWTSATADSGYEGTDYLTRDAAQDPIGGEIIIDNGDADFSSQGHWGTATASGHFGPDSLVHFPGLLPLAAEIIDNSDAGFALTGDWSSNVPTGGGQYGPNQNFIDAGALSPESIIIDNKDPGFLSIGQWEARANGSGFEGSNFQRHESNLPPLGRVMDNNDSTTSAVGDWAFSTDGSGYWGNNFQRNDAGTGADTFTWTPRGFEAGEYKIYARWRASSVRATDVPYTIHHAGGSTTIDVNQKVNGSRWNLLGSFTLEPGQNHRVVLSDDANGRVTADSLYLIRSHEVVDNLDPNTATVGTWANSTGANGFFGENFQTNDAGTGADVFTWTLEVPELFLYNVYVRWTAHPNRATDAPYTIHHTGGSSVVRVDQQSGGGLFTYVGSYQLAPGSNHRVELSDDANGRVAADAVAVLPVGTPPNRGIWTPELTQSREFTAYAKWRAFNDYAPDTPYTVRHAGGSTQQAFDQRQNGGKWMELGTFTFDPGTSDPSTDHGVEVTDQANGVVVADAIRLDPTDAPNTATWTPALAAAGDYRVYAWWRQDSNRASNAPYTIHHAGGATTVNVDQRIAGSQWNLLGTFSLAPGSGHRIELTDLGIDGRIAADAVAVVPLDAAPNQADWTPAVTLEDRYEVYAWWVDNSTRASDATYRVAHAGGETAVVVDQKTNGSQWNLLGSFDLAPGAPGDGQVSLSGDAGGRVSADAVRLVGQPRTTPRLATWSFQVPTTEAYEIYARWPSGTGYATDAGYSVHHAGGVTAVSKSQRQGGGTWNLLGSFSFEAGLDYRVELSDQGNGPVVADALYIVPASAPKGSYTWAPTLPSAGEYQVYAKWAADAGRASDAVYGIYHEGGVAEVSVHQQSGGGLWQPLGSYSFDPASNPIVVLAGGSDGTLSADAVRFVGTGPVPADLRFVHNDHLGTPQKLTDNTGTVIWDRMQTPFGLDHSVSGMGATPVRFPGQYADGESGLRYNYFRDYDPTLGRYMQSDPIGLDGGVNTFIYANDNPLGWIDPDGLIKRQDSGPYHPPEGVKVGCRRTDSCAQLLGKMHVLSRMISSHMGWDWNNPPPKGGGRHKEEIADLWRAYAKCQELLRQKNCDCR